MLLTEKDKNIKAIAQKIHEERDYKAGKQHEKDEYRAYCLEVEVCPQCGNKLIEKVYWFGEPFLICLNCSTKYKKVSRQFGSSWYESNLTWLERRWIKKQIGRQP